MPADLFISHASEDKTAIARPLAVRLRDRGWAVWFDEFELVLGDRLRETIDRGLAETRFGVVILSPHFFAKQWPQRELDGLTAREVGTGRKLILPVWHEVDYAFVARFSPTLADRLAIQSSEGLDAIVGQLERALEIESGRRPSVRHIAPVALPEDQANQLRVIARKHGATVEEVLRQAIASNDFLATLEAIDANLRIKADDSDQDLYGSVNPVVRRLMSAFERTLSRLFLKASPRSVLDVGCGEGVLTHQWASWLGEGLVVGVDLPDPALQAIWERRQRANLEFVAVPDPARELPWPDQDFDLVTAIEVLEHVPSPAALLAEMARVARAYLLVTVPREPAWRWLNVARGAYLRDLGNTPGHVNHWGKRDLIALLSQYGDVVEVRSPFPWTMGLVRLR